MKKLIGTIFFFYNIFTYSQELEFKMVHLDENLVVINLVPTKKNYTKKKIRKKIKYYKVKKGENLISIAYNNQVDWKILKKINKLEDITDIYPGQTIKISHNKGGKDEF